MLHIEKKVLIKKTAATGSSHLSEVALFAEQKIIQIDQMKNAYATAIN